MTNTQTVRGVEWAVTTHKGFQSLVNESNWDICVVVFWTSGIDNAYVVWNNSTQEVEEYFNNESYSSWNVGSLPEILESALECLIEVEDAVSDEEHYEDFPDDQDYEYESGGYDMIGGDSDLMNEW